MMLILFCLKRDICTVNKEKLHLSVNIKVDFYLGFLLGITRLGLTSQNVAVVLNLVICIFQINAVSN